jgi:hypothetical protein
MSNRNAPWYNLNEICRLAGLLSEPQFPSDVVGHKKRVRLATGTEDHSRTAANASSESEPAPLPTSGVAQQISPASNLEPVHSWEKLVAWCMVVADMEVAFAVDSQGFIIASVGTPPHEGFEGLGAEICYLIEEMGRIDPAAGALLWTELQFIQHFLIAHKIGSEEFGTYYLGMLGSRPVPLKIRQTIDFQILQSLKLLK